MNDYKTTTKKEYHKGSYQKSQAKEIVKQEA